MKKSLWVLALVALFGNFGAQAAGSASNVTITSIEAKPSGLFFFYISSPITGAPPSCATLKNAFVVDSTTAGGKVVVALVQTAYALGKTLSMTGNNLCDVYIDVESIADIVTTN